MNIQPIVEGHGDVAAFPVLLRRQPNGRVWYNGFMSEFGVAIELVVGRSRGHHHGVAGGIGNLDVVGVAQFEE